MEAKLSDVQYSGWFASCKGLQMHASSSFSPLICSAFSWIQSSSSIVVGAALVWLSNTVAIISFTRPDYYIGGEDGI